MTWQKLSSQFNLSSQCKKYGLSLWQCPQFLFVVMGLIIICSIVATYFISENYIQDPEFIALVVLFTTAILFIIATIIVQNFERLAEVSRMKSEFVSVVSHQLRSPLSNLRWAIEFLLSGRADAITEKQLEYFKILEENSDRMRELVADLLIVSKLQEGTLPFKKEEVSWAEIIQKAIAETEIFAKASHVTISFKEEKKAPHIITDPGQLKLVVSNLLDNAIRYSSGVKPGQVELELTEKGKNLFLEIKDNGIGIPQNDQKYIFQKFFRSSNILKRQTEGSGLGLYIAKSIIEKLGGKINFKSQEGVGSTFWLTIPLSQRG